jgi:hypothetical protein
MAAAESAAARNFSYMFNLVLEIVVVHVLGGEYNSFGKQYNT